MSDTKTPLPPLVSEQMRRLSSRMGNAEAYAIMQGFAADVEAIEADRAKTREVVQALVDYITYRNSITAKPENYYASGGLSYAQCIALAKSQLNIEPNSHDNP